MTQLIISDTTSLIVLEKQNQLSLLCKLFDTVIIPHAVYKELLIGLESDKTIKAFTCLKIENIVYSERLQDLLLILDQGESEAIELAVNKNLPLIIDEKKGRKIAKNFGLIVTGLAGILILATQKKVLSSIQSKMILEKSIQNGYRLSETLYKQIMNKLDSLQDKS
jgi:predicted nucleic acid-binding protein